MNTMQYNEMQYGTMQYSTIQYNAINTYEDWAEMSLPSGPNWKHKRTYKQSNTHKQPNISAQTKGPWAQGPMGPWAQGPKSPWAQGPGPLWRRRNAENPRNPPNPRPNPHLGRDKPVVETPHWDTLVHVE